MGGCEKIGRMDGFKDRRKEERDRKVFGNKELFTVLFCSVLFYFDLFYSILFCIVFRRSSARSGGREELLLRLLPGCRMVSAKTGRKERRKT